MDRRGFLKRLGIGAAAAVAVSACPELVTDLLAPTASAPVVATIGEWNNYYNFSSFSVAQAIDKFVADAAVELSYRTGQSVRELQTFVYNA